MTKLSAVGKSFGKLGLKRIKQFCHVIFFIDSLDRMWLDENNSYVYDYDGSKYYFG